MTHNSGTGHEVNIVAAESSNVFPTTDILFNYLGGASMIYRGILKAAKSDQNTISY